MLCFDLINEPFMCLDPISFLMTACHRKNKSYSSEGILSYLVESCAC